MKRVSALVLFAALGCNALSFDGKPLNQKPPQTLPLGGVRPTPLRADTSLQQHRWDRDYRDGSPVGGGSQYRQSRRNDNRRSFGNQNGYTGPPAIYNDAPRSTEEGWWNEERRNYKTSENRLDRRNYSNSKYGTTAVNNYDVTPDEWRGDERQNRSFNNRDTNRQYGSSRQRQTLRASDRDRQVQGYNNNNNNNGYQQQQQQYNNNNYGFNNNNNNYDSNSNYDPNDVTPQEWKDQQQRQQQGFNQYNQGYNNQNDGYYQQDNGPSYGFGSRGEVIGSYDQTVAYNTINTKDYDPDPTPSEWRDKQRQNGRNGGFDGSFDYRGAGDNNGLYDPIQGSWWNEERKDYSTNLGRQETRSFGNTNYGTGGMSNGSVRPDEWDQGLGNNQGYANNFNRNQQRVGFNDNRREGGRNNNSPKNNWWNNVKNGFRTVSSTNNGRRNNGNRGGEYYDDRREYVTQDNGYYNDNNYNMNNYNTNYNNNNNNNNRRDYVTQDNEWWKKEKVDSTTW
jgi:hypothetical protein